MKVKICGLTNLEDAKKACEYGADLLGFIFVDGTPRAIDVSDAGKIISALDCDAEKVALFSNETISRVVDTVVSCKFDYVQLHGKESPAYCEKLKEAFLNEKQSDIKIIKVFKVGKKLIPNNGYGPEDYEKADYFLFDTHKEDVHGGTGESFDWEVLEKVKETLRKPFFLAGGLTPENVKEAISEAKPYGVDSSSGVEKEKGKKDYIKLKEFIQNAKSN